MGAGKLLTQGPKHTAMRSRLPHSSASFCFFISINILCDYRPGLPSPGTRVLVCFIIIIWKATAQTSAVPRPPRVSFSFQTFPGRDCDGLRVAETGKDSGFI